MRFGKRASVAGVGLLFLLLILLVVALYLLYLSWPKDPVEYTFTEEESVEEFVNYSSSKQFYENMRFSEKRIGYRIEGACNSNKGSDAEEAFSILEEKTVLDFYRDFVDPQITIFCSEVEPEPKESGYFVAGEGGPTEVINTTLYGVILSGKVSFFREDKCGDPKVATHEILHVLGFDHNDNPNSILFPTLDCKQTIDDSIVRDINSLYSIKSAADLKVIDVDASNSGRYLNFNISIVNQGLKDASGVSLRVYANGDLAKEFDMGDVSIGTRKFLGVTNLNLGLFSKNEEIIFIVDEDDEIDEILETNNKVQLILEGT